MNKVKLLLISILLGYSSVSSSGGCPFHNSAPSDIFHGATPIFFGDSLTDTGNAQNLNIGVASYNAPIGKQIIWSQSFATATGHSIIPRGNNYLYSNINPLNFLERFNDDSTRKPHTNNYAYVTAPTGALTPQLVWMLYDYGLVDVDYARQAFTWIEEIANGNIDNQVALKELLTAEPLKSAKRLDRNRFYFVWAGANDFIKAVSVVSDLYEAVTSGNNSAIYAETNKLADKAVENIDKFLSLLALWGAEKQIVLNLPSLNRAPMFLDVATGGVQFAPAAEDYTRSFNRFLLQKLQQLKRPVLVVDIEKFFDEIMDNMGFFGFQDLQSDQANANQLFVDNLHPNTIGHTMISNVIYYNYLAPIITVPSLLRAGTGSHASLVNYLHGQIYQSMVSSTKSKIFVSGEIASTDYNCHDISQRSIPKSLRVGMQTKVNTNLLFGVMVSQDYQQEKIGEKYDSRFDYSNFQTAIFMNFAHEYFFVGGVVSFGQHYYNNIARNFKLHEANITTDGRTSGQHYGADILVGAHYKIGDFTTGPVVDLQVMQINVRGYHEKEITDTVTSLGLNIHQHNLQKILLGIGWRVVYTPTAFTKNLAFNFSMLHVHSLGNHDFYVEYNPLTQPGTRASFATPQHEGYMKFNCNLSMQPFSSDTSISIGYTVSVTKSSRAHYGIELGFGLPLK